MTKERFFAAACVTTLLLCAAASLRISGALPHSRPSGPPSLVAIDMTRLMLSRSDTVQILPLRARDDVPNEAKPIGAGFAARADGVIVTARSVVSGTGLVAVRFKDGTVRVGRVYADESCPLAVVRVDTAGLNPFGFMTQPIPGFFMAMRPGRLGGGPFEMISVAGKPRPDGTFAIRSPSGSVAGEPLVDVMGRVVAVNLGADKAGKAREKYVAIDARTAIESVQRLLGRSPESTDVSTVGRPPLAVKLGIQVACATPEALYSHSLSRDSKGAIVAAVFPDSPAMRGHMRVGDLLLEMGGKKVRHAEEVAGFVEALQSDQDAGIMVGRMGGRFLLPVTTGRPHRLSASDPTLAEGEISAGPRFVLARHLRRMPD